MGLKHGGKTYVNIGIGTIHFVNSYELAPNSPDGELVEFFFATKKGAKVVESPVKDGLIDLDILMDRLGALGITSLLIEGGSRITASALSAGITDKIVFFFAPKILGGDDGVPVCRGPGPDLMKNCIPVKDIDIRRFDDDVMIQGYIHK